MIDFAHGTRICCHPGPRRGRAGRAALRLRGEVVGRPLSADERLVSDVVEDFNEARRNPRSPKLFAKGAMPEGRVQEVWTVLVFAERRRPEALGRHGHDAITVRDEKSGDDAGKVEWTFEKAGSGGRSVRAAALTAVSARPAARPGPARPEPRTGRGLGRLARVRPALRRQHRVAVVVPPGPGRPLRDGGRLLAGLLPHAAASLDHPGPGGARPRPPGWSSSLAGSDRRRRDRGGRWRLGRDTGLYLPGRGRLPLERLALRRAACRRPPDLFPAKVGGGSASLERYGVRFFVTSPPSGRRAGRRAGWRRPGLVPSGFAGRPRPCSPCRLAGRSRP